MSFVYGDLRCKQPPLHRLIAIDIMRVRKDFLVKKNLSYLCKCSILISIYKCEVWLIIS